LDSTIPEPLYNLGIAYYEKGLYLEAIEAYKKFLDLKPDHENARVNLGLAYSRLKQWEQAIQTFKEELKYYPDNFYAYGYLGFIYMELKDYPDALYYFKKALTYPDLPDAEGFRKAIASIEAVQRQKEGKEN
jgi:tetratricopeptide (TPR) repeat protein